jgi:hypothetical protein
MLYGKGRNDQAGPLIDLARRDLVHRHLEPPDRVEPVDPTVDVMPVHRAHARDHLAGARRPPDFERGGAAEQEPGRHPQIGKAGDMIAVEVGQEYPRHRFRIDAIFVDLLHHAAAGIEQQQFVGRLDQRGIALPVGGEFGAAGAEQMDEHGGGCMGGSAEQQHGEEQEFAHHFPFDPIVALPLGLC